MIDFEDGTLNDGDVTMTHFTSAAATVEVVHPKIQTQAALGNGYGINVRVVKGARRLRVDMSFPRARVKYVMFAVVTQNRLAIDLWKSAPPSKAAEVRSGRDGCLTLDSWRVRPGVVSAGGREHGIFEHTFAILVRGADGRVLGQRPGVHGMSQWSTQVRYRAARRQPGTLEAVDFGGRGQGIACLAQVRVTLPAYRGRPVQAANPSPSWQPLPRAPIVGRLDASTVWTGTEMIIWGGVNRPTRGSPAPRSDGAAYNPAIGKWRKISSSPSGILGAGGPAAAWTGRRMVVYGGNSPDGPAGGAVYNPRTNSWRRLPKGPLGAREQYASVWTGRELLIFGGHSGDNYALPTAAALNPTAGSWRRLKALDVVIGLASVNGALWTGREAFVSGILYRPHVVDRPILLEFNPNTNKLREISLANAPLNHRQRRQLDPVGRSGSDIVFWTGTSSSSAPIVLYNPTSRKWTKAKPAPCKPYGQIAWIGDRLAVACGTNELQIYNPRSNSWRTIKAGRSPFNSSESSEIAWTGSELIVWSGVVFTRNNPTPADGAAIVLNR